MDLGGERAGEPDSEVVDLYCGGGGTTAGMEAALGRPVSLAAATLVKFRGGYGNGQAPAQDAREPLPTITASGNHIAEVRAFLTAFYGNDRSGGQSVLEPMRTITAKHRLGLVTIQGTEYQIADIGLRMLEPEELERATCGPEFHLDLSAATTKEAKVKLVGNAVPPGLAAAVVRVNLPRSMRREEAA